MWFSVSLLFEFVHKIRTIRTAESLYEERIVLVKAHCEEDAYIRACDIGKEEEHEYVPAWNENDMIRVTFRKVVRVCCIDQENIEEGTEVFYRLFKKSELETVFTAIPKAD